MSALILRVSSWCRHLLGLVHPSHLCPTGTLTAWENRRTLISVLSPRLALQTVNLIFGRWLSSIDPVPSITVALLRFVGQLDL